MQNTLMGLPVEFWTIICFAVAVAFYNFWPRPRGQPLNRVHGSSNSSCAGFLANLGLPGSRLSVLKICQRTRAAQVLGCDRACQLHYFHGLLCARSFIFGKLPLPGSSGLPGDFLAELVILLQTRNGLTNSFCHSRRHIRVKRP